MGILAVIKNALSSKSAVNGTLPPVAYIYDNVNLCYIEELNDDLSKAIVGAAIVLEQEPNNPADKKAVCVKCAGARIGYLYKGRLKTKLYSALNKPGVVLTGVITKRNGTEITMDIEHREDITVVVSAHGKSYHKDLWCVKDAAGLREIKLSEALAAGYEPCSKCSK